MVCSCQLAVITEQGKSDEDIFLLDQGWFHQPGAVSCLCNVCKSDPISCKKKLQMLVNILYLLINYTACARKQPNLLNAIACKSPANFACLKDSGFKLSDRRISKIGRHG